MYRKTDKQTLQPSKELALVGFSLLGHGLACWQPTHDGNYLVKTSDTSSKKCAKSSLFLNIKWKIEGQWFRTFSWGWHQIKNSCLFLALKSETSSLYLLLANNKNVILLVYILGKFITLHYIRKNLRSCCLSAKLGQHAATVPVL